MEKDGHTGYRRVGKAREHAHTGASGLGREKGAGGALHVENSSDSQATEGRARKEDGTGSTRPPRFY
eukprot:scaffold309329_cov30-Tisochrysis_lutea.AAC.1